MHNELEVERAGMTALRSETEIEIKVNKEDETNLFTEQTNQPGE